jgi:hypothetical protein
MIIHKFDNKIYNFDTLVSKVFDVNELCKLHEERSDLLPKDKLVFENESQTDFHKIFYSKMNNDELKELEEKFILFIKNEVKPLFDDDILHQYMPSFRVHLPGDKAIHKWHYDSDPDHKHPDWEINFHIPLTNSSDTQSIWIESVPGLGDYKSIDLEYGEFVIFNGNKCMHGNKENITNNTRVSFDFRILPIERYDDNLKSSVTSNRKFKEGDYYKRIT